MKTKLSVLIVLVLSVVAAGPTYAQMMEHHCPHAATVHALRRCVEHAAAQGHIDNAGIVRSLQAKLEAAQRHQP